MAKKQATKRTNKPKEPKPLKKEGNIYDKIFKEVVEKIFRPYLVVYLGEAPPTMRTQLKPEEVYTGFDLLNVQGLDTNELLSSQMPEVVIIAILSNYPKEEAETILRKIVMNLKNLIKHKRTLKIYINQLMMLSRLRRIEALAIKITEEMPIHYDIETDALYLRGTAKGTEQGKEAKNYIFVTNLLLDTDFDDAKIARLADVTLAFIQKVKDERTDFVAVTNFLHNKAGNDKKIALLANVSLEFVKKVTFILTSQK